MALQASAPGELRGALGRLGYLCAGGAKAMFVAAADLSMLPVPSREPQTIELSIAALSGIHCALIGGLVGTFSPP